MDRARRLSTLLVGCLVAGCAATAPSGSPEPTAAPAASVDSIAPSPSASGAEASPTPGSSVSGSTGFTDQVEAVPADWARFDDPDGLFTVAFPGKSTRDAGPAGGGVQASTVDEWQSTDLTLTYAVLASRYAAGRFAAVAVPDFLRTVERNMSALGQADIAAEQDTTAGSIPARDAVMTTASGNICARFLIVGDVAYAIVGTAPQQCPPHFAAFIGSFRPSPAASPRPSSLITAGPRPSG
jgi:hypothetical protein